jgi:hypothetical protein
MDFNDAFVVPLALLFLPLSLLAAFMIPPPHPLVVSDTS